MNAFGRATVGIAIIAIAAVCWDWSTQPPSPVSTPNAANTAAAETATAEFADDARATERIDASKLVEHEAVEPRPQQQPSLAPGRVVDVHGIGIAGVSLAVRDRRTHDAGTPIGSSSANGGFEFSVPAAGNSVFSNDPRWATVRSGWTRLETGMLSTVVVAPRIEVGGRVVNTSGQPLAGADVNVHLPPQLVIDLGILVDGSRDVTWRTTSDDEGRFVIRDLPAIEHAELSAAIGGYLPRFVDLPPASTQLLELKLERPPANADIVQGFVVDAFGAFVNDARVSAGGKVSRTDHRGAFTIDLSNEDNLERIIAVAKGMLPAVHEPKRDAAGKPLWPATVTLRLGQPPLSIEGKVIDRKGKPIVGAKVWVKDPTVVGMEGGGTLLAETFLGRDDSPFWAFVQTDSTGTFQLRGLLDRAYVVRALDPTTLMAMTRDAVPAGSKGVELQLTTPTYPELRGRVVTRDGSAVSGVSVQLRRLALGVGIPGGDNSSMFELTHTPPLQTDQNGEFVLKDVPTEGVQLCVDGDGIQDFSKEVTAGMDPTMHKIVVQRSIRMQVELAPPTDRADSFKILKDGGRRMLVTARGMMRVRWPLVDGRTEVLSLGEGAATIVFYKGDAQVGTLPVQLRHGQVNKVGF